MKDTSAPNLTHSEEILLMIEERSGRDLGVRDEEGRKGSFWVPQADRSERITRLRREVIVYGGGSMSAIRALLRRGWIEEVRSNSGMRSVLGYRITEDGKREAQTLA